MRNKGKEKIQKTPAGNLRWSLSQVCFIVFADAHTIKQTAQQATAIAVHLLFANAHAQVNVSEIDKKNLKIENDG